MRQAAADLGFTLPGMPDLVVTSVAVGIVALAIAAGWALGKWAGPPITDFWEKRAGSRAEGLVVRVCAVMRYLGVWLTIAIALGLYRWPPTSALLLGLVAAGAAALAARNVVRGFHLARWLSWLLALFLFTVVLADAVGGLKPVANELDRLALSIGRRRVSLLDIIQIGTAVLVLYAAARIAIRLIGQLIGGARGLDPTQRLLGQKLAAIAIIVVAFFIGIDLAGIDLTAFTVFSGAFGLAIGFGLQKTIGNLIAGIILLMDRSIKPGDVISVGQTFGSVNKIGVRAVSIVTREGKEYLIPNEILMTQEVVNWSYSTRDVRISITVNVAYGCDLKLAHQLMIEAATAAQRVLDSPKPVVWVTAFGESAIEHEIRVWIRDPEAGLGSVRSDILVRVWDLFRQNGMRVPFPQRDIRIREWPESGPPSEGPLSPGGPSAP